MENRKNGKSVSTPKQLEDLVFGEMMNEAKTGKIVTREMIMEKLKHSKKTSERLNIDKNTNNK